MFNKIRGRLSSFVQYFSAGVYDFNRNSILKNALPRIRTAGQYFLQLKNRGFRRIDKQLELPGGGTVKIDKKIGKGVSRSVYSGKLIEADKMPKEIAVMTFNTIPNTFRRFLSLQKTNIRYKVEKEQLIAEEIALKKEIGEHPNLDTQILGTHTIEGVKIVYISPY